MTTDEQHLTVHSDYWAYPDCYSQMAEDQYHLVHWNCFEHMGWLD